MRQVFPHPPIDKEAPLFLLYWNLKVSQDLLFLLHHSYGCTQRLSSVFIVRFVHAILLVSIVNVVRAGA